jgi:RNase P subunit RPR2
MALGSVVSRLRYLDGAAHLLSVASPAVSAQLLFQYNKIASENELDSSDARKRSVCGACGNIMVPGWTCHVRSQSTGSKRVSKKSLRKRRSSGRPRTTAPGSVPGAGGSEMKGLEMVYECRVCGRATRQTSPKKPPSRRPARNTAPMTSPSTPAKHLGVDAMESPRPASTNASSKRRAKARKQGGLQALLAKRKEGVEQTGDFGLDLMDLMKQA